MYTLHINDYDYDLVNLLTQANNRIMQRSWLLRELYPVHVIHFQTKNVTGFNVFLLIYLNCVMRSTWRSLSAGGIHWGPWQGTRGCWTSRSSPGPRTAAAASSGRPRRWRSDGQMMRVRELDSRTESLFCETDTCLWPHSPWRMCKGEKNVHNFWHQF